MPNYLKKIISIVIIVTFVADPNIALAADSGIFNKQNDSSTLSPTLRMKSIDVNKEEKALNTTGIDEKDNISEDFRAQSRFLYVAGEIGKAIAKKEQLKLPMDDIQRIIIEKVPDIDATGFNYKKIGLKEGRYSLDYVDNDKPLLTLNYYFVKGDLAQGQIKVADVSEKGLLVFECNMPGMDGIASIKEKETSEPKIQNSVHKRIRMSKDEKRDVGEINAQNNGIDRKALRFTNVLEKRLNRVFTAAAVRQKTGRKVEIKITPVLRYGNNEAAAWTRGFTMRATRSDMTIIHEYSMVFDRTDLKEFLFTVRHDISRIEGLNDIADIPEWEDLMYDLALQPRTMDEATVVNTAQMEITKRYYRFNDPENLYVEHPAPVIFFSPVVNLLDIFPITVMMDIDGKPFYFLERNLGLVGLTMNSGVPHMVRFTQFEYAGRIRNGIEIVRFTDNYEPTAFILRGYIDLEKGFQIIHYTREENEMNKIRLPGMRNEVLEIEAMCNLWPRLSEEITRDKTETMTSEENKKNKKPELAPLYRDMGVILGTLVGAGLLYGQFGITGIPVAAAISVLTLLPGWLIHEIGHLIGRPFGKEAEIRAGPIASLLLFSAAIIPAIVLHSYGFPSVIIDVAAANYFVHIFADGQSLLKRSGFLHPEDVNDANIPEREDQDELTPGQKLINKIKEVSARGLADYGVIKTPLIPLDKISGMMSFNRKERKVFLKDEAWQTGGSFKARGVSVEVDDAIRSRIEAIIAEEPHLQEIKASGKTPLKERPFYIVTQTTGNHGIALINAVNVAIKIYSEKYPEYKEAITNFEPVIFTIKNLPEIKFKLMTEAVEIYRKTSGKTESETIRNYYENYNKALTAREEFLREHSEDAVYMEHGGLAIMAGHATAGIEIDEQLTEEFGIGKDKNVVVIVPVGAGGPIGIGAGVKLNGRNVTFIAVGTKEYDAIIRSIDSSKVEWNKANPSPTAFIKGKPIIYPDGIAVDKSEKSAVDVARDFVDEKFVTSDKKGLNRAAPLLYSDLESYYMERAKPLAVGGTTAATLEALIENKGNEIMKNADVIVLFGTEGNVDPDITEYIYGLNSGNEPLKFGENGELTTQLIGKLKGYDIAARENIHGQRYSQAEVFIEKQRWVLKNAAAWDKEAVDQARYVIGNYLSLVNSYCRAMKNENDQKIKTDMIESCEKLLKNTTSLYEKFKREGKILGCGAYIISAYTNLAGQYGNEDFYKIERLLDTAKEILDQGAADRYGDITTEGAREVIPPITKQAEFIITGYMKLAGKMKWQDDFANALRIAEKARDLLAKYRDAPGVENVFYDVGIFYVNLAAIYRDRFRDIVFSMAMLMKAESIRIEFGEYNSAQKGHSTGNRALSSSIINGYTLTARKFSEKKQYAAAVHAIRRSGVLTWRYGTDEYKENRDIVGLMVLANAVSNILRRDVLENKQEYLNNLNDAKRILWISAQVLRKYDTPSVKAQVEYLVSAYTNLSYSYKTVGEYGLCGDVLERVERILRSYPDQQSVRDQAEFVVSSFANLAGAYREAGDLETAEKFLNRAYKVFLNFIGEYSVQRQKKFMIDDHMRLSQAFEVKGDRQKAVELSDKALKIAQTKLDVEKHKRLRAMGPIPFEMFIVFLAYGSIYKHRKEIIDFIHSKGYLRLEKAVRLLIPDLSKYRVTEWLHESLQNISIGLTIKPVAIDQGMWDLEQRIPERGQSEEAKFIEMFGGHSEEVLEFITEERNCSEISGFSIKNVKHFETAENVSRNVYRIELVLKGGHNHVFYVREYRSTDGESQIGELDWITGPIRRMTDRVEKAAAAGMVAPYARLFIDRGRCLFVQDEAQGIPVKEFIKDEETALLAAESIGYALGRLHGLGIEHGDLEIERKGSPEHNHIFIHEENDGVTANFIDFYERPFSFWRRGKVKIFGEEDDLLNKLEKYVFGKIGSENRAENEIADVFTKAYIKGNVSVGEKYRPSLVAKIKMALGKFKEKVADRMLVHKIMANSVEAIHDEERLIEASGGEARIVRSANHGTQGTVQTGEADGENIVAADNEKNEGTVTAVNGAVVLGFSQANCWTPLALYAGLLIYSELYKHRKAIIDFIHSKGYLRLEKGVRILLPDLSKYRVTRMFHKSLMNMSIGGTIKETDESNKYDLEIRARLSEVDAYIGSNELDSAEKALKRAQSILFKYVGLYPDDANIRYIVLQFISAYGSLAENAISVGDSRESLEMAFRAYNAQYRILSLKAVQEEDRNKLVVHAMVGIAKLCGSFLDLSSGAQIARACAMAERAQEIFTENRNIQKVKKRAATCVKAFCKVSEAYSKSEKYDDALSMVDKAARALKNNEKEKGVRGLMREVVRLYMSGLDEMCGNEDKLKKLMNEFRDRLKSDPSDPVTEMIFAYMMLISGNTSNAVAYAMDGITNSDNVLLDIGNQIVRTGNMIEMIGKVQDAAELIDLRIRIEEELSPGNLKDRCISEWDKRNAQLGGSEYVALNKQEHVLTVPGDGAKTVLNSVSVQEGEKRNDLPRRALIELYRQIDECMKGFYDAVSHNETDKAEGLLGKAKEALDEIIEEYPDAHYLKTKFQTICIGYIKLGGVMAGQDKSMQDLSKAFRAFNAEHEMLVDAKYAAYRELKDIDNVLIRLMGRWRKLGRSFLQYSSKESTSIDTSAKAIEKSIEIFDMYKAGGGLPISAQDYVNDLCDISDAYIYSKSDNKAEEAMKATAAAEKLAMDNRSGYDSMEMLCKVIRQYQKCIIISCDNMKNVKRLISEFGGRTEKNKMDAVASGALSLLYLISGESAQMIACLDLAQYSINDRMKILDEAAKFLDEYSKRNPDDKTANFVRLQIWERCRVPDGSTLQEETEEEHLKMFLSHLNERYKLFTGYCEVFFDTKKAESLAWKYMISYTRLCKLLLDKNTEDGIKHAEEAGTLAFEIFARYEDSIEISNQKKYQIANCRRLFNIYLKGNKPEDAFVMIDRERRLFGLDMAEPDVSREIMTQYVEVVDSVKDDPEKINDVMERLKEIRKNDVFASAVLAYICLCFGKNTELNRENYIDDLRKRGNEYLAELARQMTIMRVLIKKIKEASDIGEINKIEKERKEEIYILFLLRIGEEWEKLQREKMRRGERRRADQDAESVESQQKVSKTQVEASQVVVPSQEELPVTVVATETPKKRDEVGLPVKSANTPSKSGRKTKKEIAFEKNKGSKDKRIDELMEVIDAKNPDEVIRLGRILEEKRKKSVRKGDAKGTERLEQAIVKGEGFLKRIGLDGSAIRAHAVMPFGFAQADSWAPLCLYAGLLIYTALYKHREAIIDFIHSKGYLRLEKGVRIILPDFSKYRITRALHESLLNASIGLTIKRIKNKTAGISSSELSVEEAAGLLTAWINTPPEERIKSVFQPVWSQDNSLLGKYNTNGQKVTVTPAVLYFDPMLAIAKSIITYKEKEPQEAERYVIQAMSGKAFEELCQKDVRDALISCGYDAFFKNGTIELVEKEGREELLYPNGTNVAIFPGSLLGFVTALYWAKEGRFGEVNMLIVPPVNGLCFGENNPDKLYAKRAIFINRENHIVKVEFKDLLPIHGLAYAGIYSNPATMNEIMSKDFPVINLPIIIEMAQDKELFNTFLKNNGISVPEQLAIDIDDTRNIKSRMTDFIKNLKRKDGIVVKPFAASGGQDVLMFRNDEIDKAAGHCKKLLKKGNKVVVEGRIVNEIWIDSSQGHIDWNLRVLATWDNGNIVISPDLIEVRYQKFSDGPVNKSKGAEVITLNKFFDIQGYSKKQREQFLQGVKEFITGASMAIERVAENKKGKREYISKVSGLIGWDIMLGRDGKWKVIEANAGSVGGISTIEKLLPIEQKGGAVIPVARYMAQNAIAYRERLSKIPQDKEGESFNVIADPFMMNNLAWTAVEESYLQIAGEIACYLLGMNERRKDNSAINFDILAKVSLMRKDYNQAKYFAEQAIKIDPNDIDMQRQYVYCLAMLNESDEVIKICKRLVRKYLSDWYIWTIMGDSYRLNMDDKKAIKAYEKAVKIYCDKGQTYSKIGDAYSRLKNYEKSADAFRRALEVNPNNRYVWARLSDEYETLGCKDLSDYITAEVFDKLDEGESPKIEWSNILEHLKSGERIVATKHREMAGTHAVFAFGLGQANCWTPLALYAGLLIYTALYKHREAIIDFIHSKGYLRLEKVARILLPDLSSLKFKKYLSEKISDLTADMINTITGSVKNKVDGKKMQIPSDRLPRKASTFEHNAQYGARGKGPGGIDHGTTAGGKKIDSGVITEQRAKEFVDKSELTLKGDDGEEYLFLLQSREDMAEGAYTISVINNKRERVAKLDVGKNVVEEGFEGMYDNAIVVREDLKRRNIGAILFKLAMYIAKADGFEKFFVNWVDSANEPENAFYTAIGFKETYEGSGDYYFDLKDLVSGNKTVEKISFPLYDIQVTRDPVTGRMIREEVYDYMPLAATSEKRYLYSVRVYGPDRLLSEARYYDNSGKLIKVAANDYEFFSDMYSRWMDMNPFTAKDVLISYVEHAKGRALNNDEIKQIDRFVVAVFDRDLMGFINSYSKSEEGYPYFCHKAADDIYDTLRSKGIAVRTVWYGIHKVAEADVAGIRFVLDGAAAQFEKMRDNAISIVADAFRGTGIVIIPSDLAREIPFCNLIYKNDLGGGEVGKIYDPLTGREFLLNAMFNFLLVKQEGSEITVDLETGGPVVGEIDSRPEERLRVLRDYYTLSDKPDEFDKLLERRSVADREMLERAKTVAAYNAERGEKRMDQPEQEPGRIFKEIFGGSAEEVLYFATQRSDRSGILSFVRTILKHQPLRQFVEMNEYRNEIVMTNGVKYVFDTKEYSFDHGKGANITDIVDAVAVSVDKTRMAFGLGFAPQTDMVILGGKLVVLQEPVKGVMFSGYAQSPADLIRSVEAIGCALGQMHRNGILHGNIEISGGNKEERESVYIDETSGVPKAYFIDFGGELVVGAKKEFLGEKKKLISDILKYASDHFPREGMYEDRIRDIFDNAYDKAAYSAGYRAVSVSDIRLPRKAMVSEDMMMAIWWAVFFISPVLSWIFFEWHDRKIDKGEKKFEQERLERLRQRNKTLDQTKGKDKEEINGDADKSDKGPSRRDILKMGIMLPFLMMAERAGAGVTEKDLVEKFLTDTLSKCAVSLLRKPGDDRVLRAVVKKIRSGAEKGNAEILNGIADILETYNALLNAESPEEDEKLNEKVKALTVEVNGRLSEIGLFTFIGLVREPVPDGQGRTGIYVKSFRLEEASEYLKEKIGNEKFYLLKGIDTTPLMDTKGFHDEKLGYSAVFLDLVEKEADAVYEELGGEDRKNRSSLERALDKILKCEFAGVTRNEIKEKILNATVLHELAHIPDRGKLDENGSVQEIYGLLAGVTQGDAQYYGIYTLARMITPGDLPFIPHDLAARTIFDGMLKILHSEGRAGDVSFSTVDAEGLDGLINYLSGMSRKDILDIVQKVENSKDKVLSGSRVVAGAATGVGITIKDRSNDPLKNKGGLQKTDPGLEFDVTSYQVTGAQYKDSIVVLRNAPRDKKQVVPLKVIQPSKLDQADRQKLAGNIRKWLEYRKDITWPDAVENIADQLERYIGPNIYFAVTDDMEVEGYIKITTVGMQQIEIAPWNQKKHGDERRFLGVGNQLLAFMAVKFFKEQGLVRMLAPNMNTKRAVGEGNITTIDNPLDTVLEREGLINFLDGQKEILERVIRDYAASFRVKNDNRPQKEGSSVNTVRSRKTAGSAARYICVPTVKEGEEYRSLTPLYEIRSVSGEKTEKEGRMVRKAVLIRKSPYPVYQEEVEGFVFRDRVYAEEKVTKFHRDMRYMLNKTPAKISVKKVMGISELFALSGLPISKNIVNGMITAGYFVDRVGFMKACNEEGLSAQRIVREGICEEMERGQDLVYSEVLAGLVDNVPSESSFLVMDSESLNKPFSRSQYGVRYNLFTNIIMRNKPETIAFRNKYFEIMRERDYSVARGMGLDLAPEIFTKYLPDLYHDMEDFLIDHALQPEKRKLDKEIFALFEQSGIFDEKALAAAGKVAYEADLARNKEEYLRLVRDQSLPMRKRVLAWLHNAQAFLGFAAVVDEGISPEKLREQLRQTFGEGAINYNNIPKSLLIEAEVNGEKRYFQLVLPIDAKFDKKKLMSAIGAKRMTFVQGEDTVRNIIGYKVGLIPPLPLTEKPITVVVEGSLREKVRYIIMPYGEPDERFAVNLKALLDSIELTGIHSVRFADFIVSPDGSAEVINASETAGSGAKEVPNASKGMMDAEIDALWTGALVECTRKNHMDSENDVVEKMRAFDKSAHALFRYFLALRIAKKVCKMKPSVSRIWLFGDVGNGAVDNMTPGADLDFIVEVENKGECDGVKRLLDEINRKVTAKFNSMMYGTGINVSELIELSNVERVLSKEAVDAKKGIAMLVGSYSEPASLIYERDPDENAMIPVRGVLDDKGVVSIGGQNDRNEVEETARAQNLAYTLKMCADSEYERVLKIPAENRKQSSDILIAIETEEINEAANTGWIPFEQLNDMQGLTVAVKRFVEKMRNEKMITNVRVVYGSKDTLAREMEKAVKEMPNLSYGNIVLFGSEGTIKGADAFKTYRDNNAFLACVDPSDIKGGDKYIRYLETLEVALNLAFKRYSIDEMREKHKFIGIEPISGRIVRFIPHAAPIDTEEPSRIYQNQIKRLEMQA